MLLEAWSFWGRWNHPILWHHVCLRTFSRHLEYVTWIHLWQVEGAFKDARKRRVLPGMKDHRQCAWSFRSNVSSNCQGCRAFSWSGPLCLQGSLVLRIPVTWPRDYPPMQPFVCQSEFLPPTDSAWFHKPRPQPAKGKLPICWGCGHANLVFDCNF